ncbi:serine incorporator/TMS membrane protein [Globomyces pollinis-pini]|nr:serine incorporator/TMS membrane protein [Globomyces pollinis-pini]
MLTDWVAKKIQDISYGYLILNCPQGDCFGVLAVYRICLASSLFHLFLCFFMTGVKSSLDWRAHIQNGYWGVKFVAYLAMIILTFFLPNGFINGWGSYVNMPGAALFIMIQMILLIDFAYSVSESLLGYWEETDDRKYLIILLILTGLSYLCSVIGTGFMYAWFGSQGCQLNQFFISFNIILAIIATAASVHPSVQEANPKSGLAQASMVTIYATYLIASALTSEPNDPLAGRSCNPLDLQDKTQTTSMLVGSMFTFLALVYSTSRAAETYDTFRDTEPLLAPDEHEGTYPHDDEQEGCLYNYSFFHFIFFIASMYLAMLITNWDSVSISDKDTAVVGKSLTAVWVKVISSWLVMGLYTWTAVAPLVLPDRNWD